MTVMPGLVPGIHETREDSELRPVDGRVRPGQDGNFGCIGCIGCIYVERTSYAG